MKRPKIILLPLLLIIFLYYSLGSCYEQISRDGVWWNTKSDAAKLDYITGFLDGLDLGHCFSIWDITQTTEAMKCIQKVIQSYTTHNEKYLDNFSSSQIIDRLNSLYQNTKNSKIRINDGIWIVLNQLAGTPETEIQMLIATYRKNAH